MNKPGGRSGRSERRWWPVAVFWKVSWKYVVSLLSQPIRFDSVLQVGQEIEVRPGIVSKDNEGRIQCRPLLSKIVSLYAEQNDLAFAVPGGLIGVGTKIDPTLCRADRLVGQVLGEIGALPEIYTEIQINFFLLRRLVGVRTEGDQRGARVSWSDVISFHSFDFLGRKIDEKWNVNGEHRVIEYRWPSLGRERRFGEDPTDQSCLHRRKGKRSPWVAVWIRTSVWSAGVRFDVGQWLNRSSIRPVQRATIRTTMERSLARQCHVEPSVKFFFYKTSSTSSRGKKMQKEDKCRSPPLSDCVRVSRCPAGFEIDRWWEFRRFERPRRKERDHDERHFRRTKKDGERCRTRNERTNEPWRTKPSLWWIRHRVDRWRHEEFVQYA